MRFKIVFYMMLIAISINAQRVLDGESYFNNKQYTKAKAVYESLLNKKPGDGLYNYRYARCCYELKDYETAIKHFEMAGLKFPMRDLYLGELYFKTYRFDQSVIAYQSYISTLAIDDKKIAEYQKSIDKAILAGQMYKKVQDICIVDSVLVEKTDLLRFYKFAAELGGLNQESIRLKNNKTVDRIKYTTQRQDRIIFSDSVDGQMDIFSSYKLLDEFSPAISISEVINTPANENYPFLLLDGITMYFASDGSNSIGGYDLFITRFVPSTNNYLAPENIGMPFNSPFNDYMMVVDEQRNLGWFATDRFQQAGKVMIYCFVNNDVKKMVRQDEDLRQLAQLKIYRKTTTNVAGKVNLSETQLKESEKQVEFVINDSVVYHHLNQFKSVEALKLWEELHRLNHELETNDNKLNELRIDYSNADTIELKNAVAKEIIDFETKNNLIRNRPDELKLKIRNLENKFLQNTQKD